MKRILALIFAATLIFSCSKNTEEVTEEHEHTHEHSDDPHAGLDMSQDMHGLAELAEKSESLVEEDGKVKLADFTLDIPDSWEGIKPSSSMRLREYVLDPANSQYTVKAFYFGNQPQMVEGNVERWKAEYTNMEKFEEIKTGNDNLTIVGISGTFKLKPFPMADEFTPTSGYKTLAAIVGTKEGPYFFKIEGPKDFINKHQDNFVTFIKSYEKQ